MVSDTERTLKSDSFSASRLIAQQDAARTYAGETGRNHRIFWIATGVTVMIVVTTGGFFFWSSAVRAPASPALTPPKPAIPATLTNIAELPGPDRVAFLSAWQALSRKDLATNEFQALAPFNKNTGAFLGAHDLFSMLHVVPPPLLWDGMRGPFTLGVIHASRGNEALLVLDMRSFAETLGGMLAWEKNLPQALGDLLSQTISIDRGSNTFKDAVVANHDVRFVQNTAGETVLMYTVFNDRLLVITQSAEALDLALRQLSFFPPQ